LEANLGYIVRSYLKKKVLHYYEEIWSLNYSVQSKMKFYEPRNHISVVMRRLHVHSWSPNNLPNWDTSEWKCALSVSTLRHTQDCPEQTELDGHPAHDYLQTTLKKVALCIYWENFQKLKYCQWY
jgi:hypothetical protein